MASTTGLLMESVHLQDELKELKAEFPDEQRRFRLNMKTLTWKDPDTTALARQIFQCLQKKETISQMVRHILYNEASIYMVLSQMRQNGTIT